MGNKLTKWNNTKNVLSKDCLLQFALCNIQYPLKSIKIDMIQNALMQNKSKITKKSVQMADITEHIVVEENNGYNSSAIIIFSTVIPHLFTN